MPTSRRHSWLAKDEMSWTSGKKTPESEIDGMDWIGVLGWRTSLDAAGDVLAVCDAVEVLLVCNT
jgi:hypothetical protein